MTDVAVIVTLIKERDELQQALNEHKILLKMAMDKFRDAKGTLQMIQAQSMNAGIFDLSSECLERLNNPAPSEMPGADSN